MTAPVTSLPPREQHPWRHWLKSLESGVKRRRRQWQLAREAWAIRRQASGVDTAELVGRMGNGPSLSLIGLVESPDPRRLGDGLRSLADQWYANWHLELLVSPPDHEPVARLLRSGCGGADRVQLTVLGGSETEVRQALCTAASRCSQTHVGVWDCQETLTPDALLWVAAVLSQRPHAAWIYADEAEVDGQGRVSSFHYKPDFSWVYLLARFFTGRFAFYRRDLLARVGDDGTGGSDAMFYDLALRISEAIDSRDVVHIPQILSLVPQPEPYADTSRARAESERKAVAAALARRGIRGQVDVHPADGRLHQFRLEPRAFPKVSIIIPTRNASELVRACVATLRAATCYPDYEILVIDHESDEPALREYLAEQSAHGVLRVLPYHGRFNFADMNNQAVAATDGELLLFLNNDIDGFSDGWLEQLVATVQLDPRIAAVGSLLYYPDGTVQHAGIFFGIGRTGRHGHIDLAHDALGYCGRLRCLQEVSALTGALLLVRRTAFEELGGFDVKYPEDFNDTDLCLRLRQAGHRLVYTPHVSAYHYSSKTRRTKDSNRRVMLEQWGERLTSDPFYSPRLSAERFELHPLNHLWEARKKRDLAQYLAGMAVE